MTDGSPLSPEQKQELEDAKARTASFIGAAKIASFNGWTFGFFAVVSILTGLSSPAVLLVGLGLAAVARNELVGRKRILAFEPSAFDLLWKNQVALIGVIVAYCLWAMHRASVATDPSMQELVEVMGEDFDDLIRQLSMVTYAAVIGATLIFQGLNARYYYVRLARLREYLDQTPPWIVDLQRSVP